MKIFIKRSIDILASFCGLVFLSPLMIGISVFIKIFMPGPVFFNQIRIGKSGKPFGLLKFRTMKVKHGKSNGGFDLGKCHRITPFGKILRRYKLDELPQLINVLRGDLTLVGPRPEVRRWTKIYPEKWQIVHSVRPGITDRASIVYRNEEKLLAASDDPEYTYRQVILPHKLDLNINYVNKNSLGGDLNILLKTISEVIFK
jgi:lipopolysaccharide/colanic/teichoic acid biosynthesis glycosyltransferase